MADGTLVLVAARYSRVEYAVADLEMVKALHERLPVPTDLEAAVITRMPDGRIEVAQTYEPPRAEGARRGLGLGLAAGALLAVLPAVGLGVALVGAAGAGSALGGVIGGRDRALRKKDLKALGEVLAQGDSGLVVVTGAGLVDEVQGCLERADEIVSRPLRASTDHGRAAP